MNKLNLKGYDELMRVNDEGEKVRVLMKQKRKLSVNCCLYAPEKKTVHWYRLNGKFTKDDIDKLVNQETGKKHGRR